jgi:predicted HD phosphohydrolase
MMEADMRNAVSFTALRDATEADVRLLVDRMNENVAAVPDTLIACLQALKSNDAGLQVDRLEHSLQTATLAYRDRASEELVVAALFHDIGEVMAPSNHAQVAASVLRPYLSPDTCWLVEHHDVFQGYYYLHYLGRDRNARERWNEHPAYEATIKFCEKYDQPAFDPTMDALPMDAFEPMVRRVLSRPRPDWTGAWQD